MQTIVSSQVPHMLGHTNAIQIITLKDGTQIKVVPNEQKAPVQRMTTQRTTLREAYPETTFSPKRNSYRGILESKAKQLRLSQIQQSVNVVESRPEDLKYCTPVTIGEAQRESVLRSSIPRNNEELFARNTNFYFTPSSPKKYKYSSYKEPLRASCNLNTCPVCHRQKKYI